MADNQNMDMNRLRQDAIQRAREMQARAIGATHAENQSVNRPISPPSLEKNETAPSPKIHPHQSSSGLNIPVNPPDIPIPNIQNPKTQMGPVQDIFDILLSDSERTLLMVLIFLLVQEKGDTGLIFVLIYLLL